MCTLRRFRSKSDLPLTTTPQPLLTVTEPTLEVTKSVLGRGKVGKRKGGGCRWINVGKVVDDEDVEAGLRLSGESLEDLKISGKNNVAFKC